MWLLSIDKQKIRNNAKGISRKSIVALLIKDNEITARIKNSNISSSFS